MKVFYRNKLTTKVYTDPFSGHFRYGCGVFETLLYDGSNVRHLEQHLNRLLASTEAFGYKPYGVDYSGIIYQLLTENWLMGLPAKINICHVMDTAEEYDVFISAVPYSAPPEDKVFTLCIYPEVHDSYMSRYKTMNYMHFLMAKRYAESKGCDDALLTDSRGNVLETSTAALIFKAGDNYYVPKSENRLPSIALSIFAEKHQLEPADIRADDLKNMEILMMNSLMGIRKAVLE